MEPKINRDDLLQLRWRSGEEDLHELALTQTRIQLGDRGVDQEQNEDPDLDSGKPVPGEVSHHVLGDAAGGPSAEPVFDKLFQEAHQENDRPVDNGLEQDRFDHGGGVETAEEG